VTLLFDLALGARADAGPPNIPSLAAQAGSRFDLALAGFISAFAAPADPLVIPVAYNASTKVLTLNLAASLPVGVRDLNFLGTNGEVLALGRLSVTPAKSITLSGSATATFTPGYQNTLTLTVATANGFTGGYRLECLNLPEGIYFETNPRTYKASTTAITCRFAIAVGSEGVYNLIIRAVTDDSVLSTNFALTLTVNALSYQALQSETTTFVNAHATAGSLLDYREQRATNELVADLKAAGWFTGSYIIPAIGQTGASQAIPLNLNTGNSRSAPDLGAVNVFDRYEGSAIFRDISTGVRLNSLNRRAHCWVIHSTGLVEGQIMDMVASDGSQSLILNNLSVVVDFAIASPTPVLTPVLGTGVIVGGSNGTGLFHLNNGTVNQGTTLPSAGNWASGTNPEFILTNSVSFQMCLPQAALTTTQATSLKVIIENFIARIGRRFAQKPNIVFNGGGWIFEGFDAFKVGTYALNVAGLQGAGYPQFYRGATSGNVFAPDVAVSIDSSNTSVIIKSASSLENNVMLISSLGDKELINGSSVASVLSNIVAFFTSMKAAGVWPIIWISPPGYCLDATITARFLDLKTQLTTQVGVCIDAVIDQNTDPRLNTASALTYSTSWLAATSGGYSGLNPYTKSVTAQPEAFGLDYLMNLAFKKLLDLGAVNNA
jgi:hypothetical protein